MKAYNTIWKTVQEGGSVALCRSWNKKEGALSELKTTLVSPDSDTCPSVERPDAGVLTSFQDLASDATRFGEVAFRENQDSCQMAEPFYPRERMIVLGGGHVALPVVRLASSLGFSVVLVDDRPEFASAERFPTASQVVCDDFIHAIESLNIRNTDYVVVITRGHKCDADCLRVLCKDTEPLYLGMMGSSRRVAIVKQRMIEEGYDAKRLDRMHSPIGLRIGALTPEELAVSILGEIIQVKRIQMGNTNYGGNSDLDYEVFQILAEEQAVPKAVLTVIKTDGSSPRGAGAKMLVYPDGRTSGSIGGGTPEAQAIAAARDIIGSGTYRVYHLDMTADGSEGGEEAVCGGVMDVLIEDYSLS